MGNRYIAVVGGSIQRLFGWTIPDSPLSLGTSNEGVAATYDLAQYAYVPEGTVAVWGLRNPPAGVTVDSSTGLLSKASNVAQAALLNIEVSLSQVTAGYGEVHRTFTLSVNGVPVWTGAPTSLSLISGSTYNFSQHVSDPEGGTLTYSIQTNPGGCTIGSNTGVVTLGSVSGNLVIRATDTGGLFANTATCTVTITNPPSYTTLATGYDETYYVAGSTTNGWRSAADTVQGWDWSFPPTHTLAALSGMFQFSMVSYPSGFVGRQLTKIDMDWGKAGTGNVIEPTEGNFTLDWVRTAIQAAQFVQIDIRQTCRSYDSTATGAKGRQTTPTWLQAKLPTQNTHWCQDIYGQTTYFPWHATYQTYHRRMMDAVCGEPCASYPTGFRVDGYRLFDHPKVLFSILHGLGGNSEEFTGTAAELVKNSQTLADGFLAWVQTSYIDKVGSANVKKLGFVGSERPWYRLIKPLFVKGIGTRGGFIERWLGWEYSPQYNDPAQDDPDIGEGGICGIILEAYKNSSGVVQTGNPYPCYFDIDWTHILRDQANPPRHLQDQNEEYNFTKLTPDVNGVANLSPPVRYAQNYRYSMLRCLMTGRNNIAVERKNLGLNAYGGAEGFVSPPLMNWATINSGHSRANAPEAFCALTKTHGRSTNTLTGDGGAVLAYHNYEYLLKQREIYGATTLDLKHGLGVDSTDSDYSASGIDSVQGYPIYQWSPASQDNLTVFPKSLWHIYLARKGTQIGFELDTVFLPSARSVAVKVTYWDSVVTSWNLRYVDANGVTQNTGNIVTVGGGRVRTTTFFLSNFKAAATGASLRLISSGNVPFMFVRVIKV